MTEHEMESEMICRLCNGYNEDQTNLRSRYLVEKGRVKVKWCCRCRCLTDLIDDEGKRID